MSQQPRTRQELYDLIRQSSKEEFILEEMKRLGFWEATSEKPQLAESVISRRGEIQRELQTLRREANRLENPEAMLKAYRKQRLAASREQQKANRLAREQARVDRQQQWKERQQKEILYLGKGISGGLHQKISKTAKLEQLGLPDFADAADLAKAMELSVSDLRFLAYHREVSRVSHYRRFYMVKKSGGKRLISAPMPRLKLAQYWVLDHILAKVPVHPAAHGFRPSQSIMTNAQPHLGQEVVVNHDFKDFFPTITFKRVKGIFCALGYSEHIAIILAALCTGPETSEVRMDGQTYFVANGERHLPQGAPTSPALTNIICYRLDKRLQGLADKLGYQYTRYADDLSFSASGEATRQLGQLLWSLQQIVDNEGFQLHPKKLRVMRKGQRQEVTGLVVNESLGIDRRRLRQFRALLHQIELDGWAGKSWGGNTFLPAAVWGYANFVKMVKPEKGAILVDQVKRLLATAPKPKVTPVHLSLKRNK